jgi:Flp pilus assembly pilin Flp
MGLICGFYSLILIAYTPFALKANLPDAWTMLPLWIFTAVLGLSPAFILLISKRSA